MESEDQPKTFPAYALALLTAVSFFNYLDRMALAVLLEPIKQDLHLSDGQLGLISGLAFALLYAVLGIPLARWADRHARLKLLASCLAVWSVMTALTGLARNLPQLFLARVGVGIGEAGCSPAAHSLIADYLGPERRAFGISLFQAGGMAGLSGGLLIAGLLADEFGWRHSLALIGAAGLPLALLLRFTLREPPRRHADPRVQAESALAEIRALLRRTPLLHLIFAISIGSFGTYGIVQWLPAFFIRTHHLSLSQVGIWSSLSAGGGGIVGVVLGGLIATRLVRRQPHWELWVPAIAYTASAPLYAAVFLSPSPWIALGIKFFATLVAASGVGVSLSAIQAFAEPHRRATAVALALFLQSLVGMGLGPLLVGVLSDILEPTLGAQSLRYALVASVIALPWAGVHFWLASRSAAGHRV